MTMQHEIMLVKTPLTLLTKHQPYQRLRPGIRYRERQFDEGIKGSKMVTIQVWKRAFDLFL